MDNIDCTNAAERKFTDEVCINADCFFDIMEKSIHSCREVLL